MVSPSCTIDSLTPPQTVTAGLITIALADLAGVSQWSIQAISTSQDNAAWLADLNAQLAASKDNVAKDATFTMPSNADGYAILFESGVNAGRDVNGTAMPAWTERFLVHLVASNGLLPVAFAEREEYGSAGWIPKINEAIADVSAGGGSGDVTGPASSVDTEIARYNGTTGKIIRAGGTLRLGSTGNLTNDGNSIAITATGATSDLVFDAGRDIYLDCETGEQIYFREGGNTQITYDLNEAGAHAITHDAAATSVNYSSAGPMTVGSSAGIAVLSAAASSVRLQALNGDVRFQDVTDTVLSYNLNFGGAHTATHEATATSVLYQGPGMRLHATSGSAQLTSASGDVSVTSVGATSDTTITAGRTVRLDPASGQDIQMRPGGSLGLTFTLPATGAQTVTHAAGATSVTYGWTQDGSGAGGVLAITGQQGAAGSVGGDLNLSVGDGGTPGTNAAGNLNLDLGTVASAKSGRLNLQSSAGVFLSAQETNSATAGIRFGSGAYGSGSAGAYNAGIEGFSMGITATTTSLVLTALAGDVYIDHGSGQQLYFREVATVGLTCEIRPTGASSFQWVAGCTSVSYSQAQDASAAGADWSITAQQGASGFNGGNLILGWGLAGSISDGDGNIALGVAPSGWQSMEGGFFLANMTTAPTGNPTAGGYMYVDAGALKYRGSSGTITTLAVA